MGFGYQILGFGAGGVILDPVYVAGSGGDSTATVDTDYKVHTFLSSGTFTVSNGGNSAGSNQLEVLVVGGGGSGGADLGGGGGAGGLIDGTITAAITAADYTITVGGGASGPSDGAIGVTGSDSYFGQGAASSFECKGAG